MFDYTMSTILPRERLANKQMDALLEQEGIRRDPHLDYTCGLFDHDMNLVATGSCFGNTLRCMAVSHHHQGEGLMNQVVSHLVQVQYQQGNVNLFLYTKCNTAMLFGDLGFYEVARVEQDNVVFMENRRNGFQRYRQGLVAESPTPAPRTAALVMNANPFTLGHQFLVETAAAASDQLHLFIVSEEASLIPFAVRRRLVMEGTAHLNNIVYHDSGPYMISSATFPSYFQKDAMSVIEGQARLDLQVFCQIASALGITQRYVGDEPTSQTTNAYNRIMQQELPAAGVACHVIPRKESGGQAISASVVREAIRTNNWDGLDGLVPESTLRYLKSAAAEPVIRRIQETENVIHH